MLVEGEFFVVGDYDDAEVILIFFMNLVDENFSNTFALVFGAHEKVMHVSVHDAVVHRTNHADEFVAIPGRDDGLEVLHRDYELVGEMSRGPFDGEEQVF